MGSNQGYFFQIFSTLNELQKMGHTFRNLDINQLQMFKFSAKSYWYAWLHCANMLQNMFLLGSCKWKWKRPISPIYTYLSFCVGTFVVWCIAKFLHKFFYPVNQSIVLSILFLYLENIVIFCCNILNIKKNVLGRFSDSLSIVATFFMKKS